MVHFNAAKPLHASTQTDEVRVPSRFCGPPGSGNGGYTAGLVGKHLGRAAEITLKRPIPLDRTLTIVSERGDEAILRDATTDLASARTAELDIDVPEAVTFSRAAMARANFAGYRAHPFPHCFVCGTRRCCGDGMCLFPGAIAEGLVATSWVPDREHVTGGTISPELICAALDCPGAWALIDRYGIAGPFVLGRMTYRLDQPILPDERYIILGWATGRERRKAYCGTAIYDADGVLCASAAATWIELR